METIKKIDVLTHPFATHYLSPIVKKSEVVCPAKECTKEEAELFLGVWKCAIDKIAAENGRILIVLGNLLDDDDFRKIKAGQHVDSSYEAGLVLYAHKKLGSRFFFFHDTLKGKDIAQIRAAVSKDATVYVYGEWLSHCCFREASLLSELLGMPRKRFMLLAERSLDSKMGYPRRGEFAEARELPEKEKKERIKELRKRMISFKKRLDAFRKGGVV